MKTFIVFLASYSPNAQGALVALLLFGITPLYRLEDVEELEEGRQVR